MGKIWARISFVFSAIVLGHPLLAAELWNFSVSGDSRNCGNVMMPMIAESVKSQHSEFYWHLGDFRALYKVDEDFAAEPEHRPWPRDSEHVLKYQKLAWQDFLDQQILPFGKTPVRLGIGNHEIVLPGTQDPLQVGAIMRKRYLSLFGKYLDPAVVSDRQTHTYYSWKIDPVAFINLDNASPDQFSEDQYTWFKTVIAQYQTDPKILSVVVGMHEALPDSISIGHSMSETGDAKTIEAGRGVYRRLAEFQKRSGKKVYILASHSHFYMEGIFNTPFWKADPAGVLPGWIVGTAGAQRYPLPHGYMQSIQAMVKVTGYLLGHVKTGGSIDFKFHLLSEADLPTQTRKRYGDALVSFCFDENFKADGQE